MKTGILRKKGDWYQVEYKKGINIKRTELPRSFNDINESWVDKEIQYDTNSNGVVIKVEFNGEFAEAAINSTTSVAFNMINDPKKEEAKEKEVKKDHIGRKTNKFAISPYNFVPINNEVLFVGGFSSFDKYEKGKKSGFISLSVKNLTPLFLRQISDKEENFGYGGNFGIPGSSFRGMIRTMCEILSYSKMSFYNKGYLYFRGTLLTMDKIHAGMIEYDEKVKNYKIYKCKYDVENTNRWQQNEIRNPLRENDRVIFTTGKFGRDGYNKFEFFDKTNENPYIIKTEDEVYLDYINDKTAKKNPDIFDKKRKEQFPVFYQLNSEGSIKSIGTAKYHRIPYSKRTVDHLPDGHQNGSLDICESLFGIIKNNNLVNISSKVQFGDIITDKVQNDEDFMLKILSSPKPTTYQHYLEQNDISIIFDWDSDKLIRGNKLYWHRKTESKFIEENQNFEDLLIKYKEDYTYDVTWNEPWTQTKDNRKKTKSHALRIKPIKEGANFTGKIWFQNLSDIELGLLLTALEPDFKVNQNERIAHKIGLAKPLGLGSIEVKVDDVHIFETSKDKYYSSYEQKSKICNKKEFKKIFISALSEKLGVNDIWENDRLKQLKTMLTWDENEVASEKWLKKTRYMEITRGGKKGNAGNEFIERPILPKPTIYKESSDDKFVDKS